MSENKRNFSRIKLGGQACEIEFRGQRMSGVVKDLSIDGFGITGIETESLEYGEKITVVYDDESFECRCCSAKRNVEGELQIGVRKNAPVPLKQRMLVSQFVDCGECKVACRVIGRENGNRRVRFLDGKSFSVSASRLTSYTIRERSENLADPKQLAMMIEFYSLSTKKTIYHADEFDVDAVVAIEFAGEMAACN